MLHELKGCFITDCYLQLLQLTCRFIDDFILKRDLLFGPQTMEGNSLQAHKPCH